jgi:hypothetical protein
MKKGRVLLVAGMLAVFLNVSGAYADTMFGLGATLFVDGDGVFGINAIVPQVGWTSAKRKYVTRRATRADDLYQGIPEGTLFKDFQGMEFDHFDVSILFDMTTGFGLYADVLNFSSGLTTEFYFLPLWKGTLGAGIGGGWGFVNWIEAAVTHKEVPNPYGAPYVRVTVPYVLFGLIKTGVYFDYFFTDDPYTQFNVVALFLL